jgi:hypothetical protein
MKTETTSEPELETTAAEISPAEPELRRASRLDSRGGRSERECGLSSAPGREITELLPRAQAFVDQQTRETLRMLDLDERVQALRNATTTKPRPKVGPRKRAAWKVFERFPRMDGRGYARLFDDARVSRLPSMGKLSWLAGWDSRDLKLRACVRRWTYGARDSWQSPVTER